MKNYKITVTNNLTANDETFNAKSEANMWNMLRNVRNGLTKEAIEAGVRAVVTDTDGNTFKDITFIMNKKGKIEMPNAIKETCRRFIERAKKATVINPDEIHANTPIPDDLPPYATEFNPKELEAKEA